MGGVGYWSAIEIKGLWCVIAGGKVFSGGKKKGKKKMKEEEEEEEAILEVRLGSRKSRSGGFIGTVSIPDQTVDVRSSGGIITGGHRGKDDGALCR